MPRISQPSMTGGRAGQLRGAPARLLGSALPDDWDFARRRGGERLAGLRLGLPVWFLAGLAGEDLRFKATDCAECNLCRTYCPAGVKVDQAVNVTGCIRCLECTKRGAITPAFSRPNDAGPVTEAKLS